MVEIRSKLGQTMQWKNAHSNTARVLYTVILETLNLATTKNRLPKQSWIDVEPEIDGRHAVCDRARKLFSVSCLSTRCFVGIQTDSGP